MYMSSKTNSVRVLRKAENIFDIYKNENNRVPNDIVDYLKQKLNRESYQSLSKTSG